MSNALSFFKLEEITIAKQIINKINFGFTTIF